MPITTYDVAPRPLEADLDLMSIEVFAERVARIDHRHPFVRVSKARAQALLAQFEDDLVEDAVRGPTCAVAYGQAKGAILFAQQLGLIEPEELAGRMQRADELYLRRGQ